MWHVESKVRVKKPLMGLRYVGTTVSCDDVNDRSTSVSADSAAIQSHL